MRIAEQMRELKTRRQGLRETIMITRNSLNKSAVTYEEDTCPFCGRRREKRWSTGGRTAYRQCECEENQKAKEEWGALIRKESDYTDQLEAVEREIASLKKKSVELLEQSNLGRRFKDRTFESFQTTDFDAAYRVALEYAQRFEENTGKGLLFIGTPGTGKTHLAAAMTNYIISEFGIPVKFGSFIDLLDNVKRGFKTDEEVVQKLQEVPLLVIDDLGKERQTQWSNAVLYQVINGRYENYLPIVITTNETMKTLEENIGQATVSRLIEMCSGVKMVGKDFRKERLG